MSNKMVLTQTGFGRLRACPKMFRIMHIDGYQPRVESEALGFGTIWHDMKELENKGHDVDSVCKYAIREARDEQEAAKLCAMHEAHVQRRQYGPLAETEAQFEIALQNPDTGRTARNAVIAGKVDGVLHDLEGIWIVEYKTASTITGAYITRLSLDLQIHLYKLAAERERDIPVVGVVYDAIKKPTIRQNKKESADEYRERVIAWYNDNADTAFYCDRILLEDRDIERQAWMYYQEILWRLRNDYWPRNSSTCLHLYGTRCPLFGYCDSGDKQHILDADFVRRRLNPELNQ